MIGAELIGFKELQAKFAQLTDMDHHKFFAEEFKPIGDLLVTSMRNLTPVSKAGVKSGKYSSRSHARGNLKASIGKKMGGDQIPVVWVNLNRVKSKDAWYDHIVVGGHEYGGTMVRPNPIVRKTWDSMEPVVKIRLKDGLQMKLKGLWK
jgi:hypothetical protein